MPNSVLKGFVDDNGIKSIDWIMNNWKNVPKDPVIKDVYNWNTHTSIYYLFSPDQTSNNHLENVITSNENCLYALNAF